MFIEILSLTLSIISLLICIYGLHESSKNTQEILLLKIELSKQKNKNEFDYFEHFQPIQLTRNKNDDILPYNPDILRFPVNYEISLFDSKKSEIEQGNQ